MVKDYKEHDENLYNTRAEKLKEFQRGFEAMDNRSKGCWGEKVTLKEANAAGHVILTEHTDNPNAKGFDCVSMNPNTRELHIWEVKNWGSSTSIEAKDLTAWDDQKNNRKPFRDNWNEVINSVPEGPVRDAVRKAINDGNVTYHLRLGPETKLTSELQKELDNADVPGAKYDWKHYTDDEMMGLL